MKFQKYASNFTERPRYVSNCVKAFIAGGIICEIGWFIKVLLLNTGMKEETAGIWVTVSLICIAQLLTGFGVYDVLGKIGGAGCSVPITGFANSVVAPAMEYKKEGPVLGVGSKIFSLSGPVILLGLATSWIAGIIHWLLDFIL